jgi:hypothetical protein
MRDRETFDDVVVAFQEITEFLEGLDSRTVNVFLLGSVSDQPDWVLDLDYHPDE